VIGQNAVAPGYVTGHSFAVDVGLPLMAAEADRRRD
jgi:hypothetical protein